MPNRYINVKFAPEPLGFGFLKINNQQDYEDLFLGLIEQKELEEQRNAEVEV